MIVVDTNIISYLYLAGEKSRQAQQLLTVDSHWCAPALWRSEFRSVLRIYLRKDLLSLDDVLLIFDQASQLLADNVYEVPTAHIMQLVQSSNCSSYDCEFVALATYLGVPLVTADRQILREFPVQTRSLDAAIGI